MESIYFHENDKLSNYRIKEYNGNSESSKLFNIEWKRRYLSTQSRVDEWKLRFYILYNILRDIIFCFQNS